MASIDLSGEREEGKLIVRTTSGSKTLRFASVGELTDRLMHSGIDPFSWNGSIKELFASGLFTSFYVTDLQFSAFFS